MLERERGLEICRVRSSGLWFSTGWAWVGSTESLERAIRKERPNNPHSSHCVCDTACAITQCVLYSVCNCDTVCVQSHCVWYRVCNCSVWYSVYSYAVCVRDTGCAMTLCVVQCVCNHTVMQRVQLQCVIVCNHTVMQCVQLHRVCDTVCAIQCVWNYTMCDTLCVITLCVIVWPYKCIHSGSHEMESTDLLTHGPLSRISERYCFNGTTK